MIEFNKPTIEREHPANVEGISNGIQKIWKFSNGYGASVIQFKILGNFVSYTSNDNEWELAVLRFKNNDIKDTDNFDLCYTTQITANVIGHLTSEEVIKILERIEKLET